MKNKTLFVIFLVAFASNTVTAQIISVRATMSPSNSTLIGSESCIGFHYDNRSSYYMRYNDTSYLCCALNTAITLPAPSSLKISMPQDFIISDFKKFRNFQGFIGSYEGSGMFGLIYNIDILTTNLTIQTFKLPAVDRLNRIDVGFSSYYSSGTHYMTKAFSIGEKSIPSTYFSQSYLLEFYAEGCGYYDSYKYVPLACDPLTGAGERADDVIIVDDYVIFATRDTRTGHEPINLRISDTSDVIGNSEIDYQWQLILPKEEHPVGKLRLIPLDDDTFILAYVIYNEIGDNYHLYVHRIALQDIFSGTNSIISHEIKIQKECSEMIDVIYEPNVNTMVLLLNGERESSLYHINPYSNTNDQAYRLDYQNGSFYSLDTIGDYTGVNLDMYYAIGGNDIFFQDISGGFVIDQSCLPITRLPSNLRDCPKIIKFYDPIESGSGDRIPQFFENNSIYFEGLKSCYLTNPITNQ